MEIRIRGLDLFEALEENSYRLEECQIKGKPEISIINGNRKGQVLKNYIQSWVFLKEMKREGFRLKRIESSNPGVSSFTFN